jgi:hypothetical protein
MGGAYLNFELAIHIVRFILKIFKKYHENQRKKLILTNYVFNKFKFHAKTLFIFNEQFLLYFYFSGMIY